jgi:hypothetical protein
MPTDILTLSTIEYELKEKAMAAELFFRPLEGLDESCVFQIHAKLIQNLIKLCKRQEAPTRMKVQKLQKQSNSMSPTSHMIGCQVLLLSRVPSYLPCPIRGWCDEKKCILHSPYAVHAPRMHDPHATFFVTANGKHYRRYRASATQKSGYSLSLGGVS